MSQTLCVLGAVCCLSWSSSSRADAISTAFYYGRDVPSELSVLYDQIVVEPAYVADPLQLARQGAVPVAYFSVGELGPADTQHIEAGWVLAHNAAWRSTVMDPRQPGYRQYVMARLERLWQAGYRRFFLDTLDSYQLGTSDPREREQLRGALVELLTGMARQHPDAQWLLNRGFELLPDLSSQVQSVVAESLFDRWDAARGQYLPVPEADRDWLIAKLREVQTRYRLPVTVIDYRPAAQRSEARATAAKIVELGFQPWVCNATLTSAGIGSLELVPRRVLLFTDAAQGGRQNGPARWLAPVLEHLGYLPEYQSPADPLPDFDLLGRYQGIISVLSSNARPAYATWLLKQIRSGMRVAMFGQAGFAIDTPIARELGMAQAPPTIQPAQQPIAAPGDRARVVARDELVGFEAEPPAHDVEGLPLRLEGAHVLEHLRIRTDDGRVACAIASTAWGGVAFSHVFAMRGLHGEFAWVLDPFAFLSRALALPERPVPDISTESGRRVALFVIDADGLGQRARLRGRPRVWSVLENQILDRSQWLHAIDLESVAREPIASDRAAALNLLDSPLAYRRTSGVPTLDLLDEAESLTNLPPLFDEGHAGELLVPIAQATNLGDAWSSYLDRRLIEAFAAGDSPRRLRPIVLHYTGSLASSPGGVAALHHVYAWLSEQGVFPIRLDDYEARVAAFREQVLARHLDGSYSFHGGSALRTVRVPAQLGLPDLAVSQGVAAVRVMPQGEYVTFSAQGARRLALARTSLPGAHLEQANGRVERFEVESAGRRAFRVRLRIVADAPLEFQLGGLPIGANCELRQRERQMPFTVDEYGMILVTLPERDTAQAVLFCRSAEPGS